MLDVDHFKKINDTHGHAGGDTVLRDCAAAWKSELRDQDLLGRVSGEEFCVILPETPVVAVHQVAEKLRLSLGSTKLMESPDGVSLPVTVSIGFTMIAPGDTEFGQLMERADRALYLAKERGRNRVESLDAVSALAGKLT